MTRTSRIIFCIVICLLFSGCTQTTLSPTAEISPTEQVPLTPTVNPATSPSTQSAPTSIDPETLLRQAIGILLDSDSFQMEAHNVTSYKILNYDGTPKRQVFGESHTIYSVLHVYEPALQIYKHSEYRFNPQDPFLQEDVYIYQENDQYYSLPIDGETIGEALELDPRLLEPFTGDVYQTLVNYADLAKFTSEDGGALVFTLEHPKWYQLKGAIGFADLGILLSQPNSEQLIEQYVMEHYPNVKPPRFTIYVSPKDNLIRVVVDDRDFMTSVWAEVHRALIAAGEKPENLNRYEVMDENSAVYIFDKYNQVEDFEIPGK